MSNIFYLTFYIENQCNGTRTYTIMSWSSLIPNRFSKEQGNTMNKYSKKKAIPVCTLGLIKHTIINIVFSHIFLFASLLNFSCRLCFLRAFPFISSIQDSLCFNLNQYFLYCNFFFQEKFIISIRINLLNILIIDLLFYTDKYIQLFCMKLIFRLLHYVSKTSYVF